MKRVLCYGAAFVLTVMVCLSMLLVATYAPQGRIDDSLFRSVDGMVIETAFPVLGDRTRSALLDNYTDAWILMQSKAMVKDSKSTVLTNPAYDNFEDDPVTALSKYVHMVKPTPTWYYTRYWMGFRAVMRWLLVFLDYFQIRRYLNVVFFTLLFSVLASVSKHLGQRHGFALALAVLFVRPQIICSSLQFSCCFLIAFSAMLLVPWLHRHKRYQDLFFMELGMITMYFDFYTTPLITFGLPMLYLCLLRLQESGRVPVMDALKKLLLWLAGYLGMWLSKLLLTDLLTDQEGFSAAWNSASVRLGLSGQRAENSEMYSPLKALRGVWETILPDAQAVCVFVIAVLILTGLLLWKWSKKELDLPVAKRGLGILVFGLMPLIWFGITAQPTILHSFFQYRNVVILFWAVNSYLCMITDCSANSGRSLKYHRKNEK